MLFRFGFGRLGMSYAEVRDAHGAWFQEKRGFLEVPGNATGAKWKRKGREGE
jgi:hypothetical protein